MTQSQTRLRGDREDNIENALSYHNADPAYNGDKDAVEVLTDAVEIEPPMHDPAIEQTHTTKTHLLRIDDSDEGEVVAAVDHHVFLPSGNHEVSAVSIISPVAAQPAEQSEQEQAIEASLSFDGYHPVYNGEKLSGAHILSDFQHLGHGPDFTRKALLLAVDGEVAIAVYRHHNNETTTLELEGVTVRP
jgi:hypothetical protein